MSKEYLDVLNENGEKTGKIKLRDEVHKDGDWHKTVHIWVFNTKNELLLQRRCPTKDSNPNMLDISVAGHLTAGDDSIIGAIRELKEELNLDVTPSELKFIKTLKKASKYTENFINNSFNDIYALKTDKELNDMTYQKEEISEIFFVSYDKFNDMIQKKQKDLRMRKEEFEILLKYWEKILDNRVK